MWAEVTVLLAFETRFMFDVFQAHGLEYKLHPGQRLLISK